MAGFAWRYNLSGNGAPLIQSFFMKDTETLTKGDIGNVETGEIDLAVTSDAALAGAIMGAFNPSDEDPAGKVSGTDSTTLVKVIINPDAVYGVTDANARQPGALLDISLRKTLLQPVSADGDANFHKQ